MVKISKSKEKSEPPRKNAKTVDIPKELHDLKYLSRQLFEAKVNELFFMTREQMLRKIKDGKASVIDLWLTKLVLEGAKTGDLKSLQFLLERIIGPVNRTTTTIVDGHMSWVQYIEEHGVDDFSE
jgi:hypothetical protein